MPKINNMKKIIDQLRTGDGKVRLSERELPTIGSPLSSNKTTDAITDFDLWNNWWFPRYEQIGASVFDVREGKQSKVPSLAFEAKMVEVGNDVPESVIDLDSTDLPPRRIGVSIPMSVELMASMSDTQMISFIKAGIYAIQEEILAVLLVRAADTAIKTVGGFDVAGLIDLQRQVDDTGVYFGASKGILKGKETPVVAGKDDFLFERDAFEIATSFDKMLAFGSKKLSSETIIGYGNFKFSAVLLYSDYHVIIDRYTMAKKGKVVYTFYQMANVGIVDESKFAVTVISAPVIYSQPKDATVKEGETLVLSVEGIGADTFVWKKDGVPLVNGGAISGADTYRLIIKPTALSDDGAYTVELTNTAGTTISDEVAVTIDASSQTVPPPTQQTNQPTVDTDVNVDLDGSVEVDVSVDLDGDGVTDIEVGVDVDADGNVNVDISPEIDWRNVNATRSAIRAMKEYGINPDNVVGTGRNGRIGKGDVTTYIDSL